MSQSAITQWLDFALQQMAAESYLDQLFTGRPLRDILGDGNNDTRIIQPNPTTGTLPGKTQFTSALVDRFLDRYQIVDHHANDATGFSATLMKNQRKNWESILFEMLPELNSQGRGR